MKTSRAPTIQLNECKPDKTIKEEETQTKKAQTKKAQTKKAQTN
jgi:hypothetical protein